MSSVKWSSGIPIKSNRDCVCVCVFFWSWQGLIFVGCTFALASSPKTSAWIGVVRSPSPMQDHPRQVSAASLLAMHTYSWVMKPETQPYMTGFQRFPPMAVTDWAADISLTPLAPFSQFLLVPNVSWFGSLKVGCVKKKTGGGSGGGSGGPRPMDTGSGSESGSESNKAPVSGVGGSDGSGDGSGDGSSDGGGVHTVPLEELDLTQVVVMPFEVLATLLRRVIATTPSLQFVVLNMPQSVGVFDHIRTKGPLRHHGVRFEHDHAGSHAGSHVGDRDAGHDAGHDAGRDMGRSPVVCTYWQDSADTTTEFRAMFGHSALHALMTRGQEGLRTVVESGWHPKPGMGCL